MRSLIAVIILFSAIISGCAVRSVLTERFDRSANLRELIDKQNARLASFAGLVRVKLSRGGKIDDFRVEVFSDSLQRLSLYMRGFLGKSMIKAVVTGDSLRLYFPSEKKHFTGRRNDLETGDLQGTAHIIDYLLALLQGNGIYPDTADWSFDLAGGRDQIKLFLNDRRHHCELKTIMHGDETFPYLRLESTDFATADSRLKASIKLLSAQHNRPIPETKFALEIPPTAVALSKEELVDLLTRSFQ